MFGVASTIEAPGWLFEACNTEIEDDAGAPGLPPPLLWFCALLKARIHPGASSCGKDTTAGFEEGMSYRESGSLLLLSSSSCIMNGRKKTAKEMYKEEER